MATHPYQQTDSHLSQVEVKGLHKVLRSLFGRDVAQLLTAEPTALHAAILELGSQREQRNLNTVPTSSLKSFLASSWKSRLSQATQAQSPSCLLCATCSCHCQHSLHRMGSGPINGRSSWTVTSTPYRLTPPPADKTPGPTRPG